MAIARDRKRLNLTLYEKVFGMLEQLADENGLSKSDYLQDLIISQWDDKYGLYGEREDKRE